MINGCSNLRAINLSKNQLSVENLNYFLNLVSNCQKIESLNLSGLQISRDSLQPLNFAVQSLRQLKKLDISNNMKVSFTAIQNILRALISNKKIEYLNLSQTGINNDPSCMQLIGSLISSNYQLKKIVLQKIGLSDIAALHLADPLSTALHIEELDLDYNNIGPVFIEKLVNKLVENKTLDNVKRDFNMSPGNASKASSLFTEESEQSDQKLRQ